MFTTEMRYARLDRPKIAKLRQLEEILGSWVIALEPPQPPPLAELTLEQLEALKTAEKELGVVLLAYQPVNSGQ